MTIDYDELDRLDRAQQARLDSPGALRAAALWYGSQGIPCFPLLDGGKLPRFGKAHPDDAALQKSCQGACGKDGHGLYDATTDLDRIAAWWDKYPQANIGLPTGRQFDVIDIDGPRGYLSYANMLHQQCPPDCCATPAGCHGDNVTWPTMTGTVVGRVITAGDNGGSHWYILPTGQGNNAAILEGVDYRGLGGYVVAPPSRGRKGRYTWAQPLDVTALVVAA